MGKMTGSDRQHPTLGAFAATLDDDELDQLGRAYDQADAQLRALRGHGADIAARLGEIDLGLLGADGDKARDRLLGERARLGAERDSLPGQIGELARQHGLTHLRWLHRLWQLASDEATRCEAALARPGDENLRLRAAILKSDSDPAERRLPHERVTDLHARSRALVAEMQPTASRQRQAELVANVAQVRATSVYGDAVRLADGRTRPAAIEGAARRIAPRAPLLVG